MTAPIILGGTVLAAELIARELKCMDAAVRRELMRVSLSTGAT
jgi:hypothetical protein